MRVGFVALTGRPNAGKSTLLNRILGEKVSIVSDKPQTTRGQVRGILNRPDAQVVFVDTPGIHKPRTLLGQRLNAVASDAVADVDVVVVVLDAKAPLGVGDQFVLDRAPANAVIVITKTDVASRGDVLRQLTAASQKAVGDHEFFPVSGATGDGVDALVAHLVSRLPEGPLLYPLDILTDTPEMEWVAELVREQLLAVTHDEVPYSVACRVTDWEWPHIRVEIIVERKSQKGIVIGHQGAVLKEVGTRVREQLPAGAFVELVVKVDPDWQRRPAALNRLGY